MFSPFLRENTKVFHYKGQLVNAVYGNISCLFCQKYETNKYILWAKYRVIEFKGDHSYSYALKGDRLNDWRLYYIKLCSVLLAPKIF